MAKDGNVKGLAVEVSADSKGFDKSIKQVNAELKKLDSEFNKAKSSVKDYSKNTDVLANKQDYLKQKIQVQKELIEKYKEAVRKSSEQVQRNTEKHDELARKLKEKKQAYQDSIDKMGKESEQTKKLGAQVSKLESEYKKAERAIQNASMRVTNYTTCTNNAEAQLNEMNLELRETQRQLTLQSSKWTQLATTMSAVTPVLKTIEGTLRRVGMFMTMYVTTPLTIAGAAAVKTGAEFEAQMSKVESISLSTAEEMQSLTNAAKQVGESTKFTATQAGQALEYMGLAGWKAKEMIAGLPAIIDLATASGEELAMVSDIVTDDLTAFGMKSNEAGYFCDVLSATVTNSNTNVEMLGQSFKYAGAVAGAFGYNVKDTALVLGTLANSGIKASMAGRQARKLFSEFSNDIVLNLENGEKLIVATKKMDGTMRPLKDVIDDLRVAFSGMSESQKQSINDGAVESAKQLGIALEDENGQFKNVAQLCAEATEAIDGLTDAEKVAQAEALGGKVAMAGILTLVNSSEESYNKLANAIENSAGTTSKMAGIMIDNVKGQFTLMTSNLQAMAIELFEMNNGPILDFIKNINDMITGFRNLDDDQKNFILKLGMVAIAVGPVTRILSGLVGVAGTLTGAISSLSTAIAGAGGLSAALGTFTSIATPIGLIITGLVGGLALYAKAAHTAKEKQELLNDTMRETNRIKLEGIGVTEKDSYIVDAEKLQGEINLLELYQDNLESVQEKKEKAQTRMNYLSTREAYDELGTDKIEQEYNSLIETLDMLDKQESKTANKLEGFKAELESQYGSIDNAKKRLTVLNDELKETAKNEEFASKITSKSVLEMNEQADASIKTAGNLKLLGDEFRELTGKEKLSSEEKQRLNELERQLITTYGDTVTAINEETGEREVSLEMIAREEKANRLLGESKKQLVAEYIDGGKTRLESLKQESLKAIEIAQNEMLAINRLRASFLEDNSKQGKDGNSMNLQQADSYRVSLIESLKKEANAKKNLADITEFLNKINDSTSDTIGGTDSAIDFSTEDDDKKKTKSTSSKEKTELEKAIESFEKRKKVGQVALDSEMYELQVIKNKYAKTAEEKADINDYMYKNYMSYIDRKNKLYDLSSEKELKMLQYGLKNFAFTEEQKAELTTKSLDTRYNASKEYIDKQKSLGKLNLYDELAAWERVKSYTDTKKEYQIEAEKQIYSIKKQIADQEEKDRQERLKEVKEELKEEYDAKVKAYNDELDALEDTVEQEDRERKEREYAYDMNEIMDKMNNARTQEEFLSLSEKYNDMAESREEFRRQNNIKDKKKEINEKIKLAKEEYDRKVELADKQAETDAKITEKFGQELTKRETLLSESISRMKDMYSSMLKGISSAYSGNVSTSTINVPKASSGTQSTTNNSTSTNTSTTNNTNNNTFIIKNQTDAKNILKALTTGIISINRAKGITS